MKWYKKNGDEYVQNGRSLVKVHSLAIVADPYNPGRVGRVVAVKEVVKINDRNPICPGFQFCLSIPKERINAKEYTWKRDEVKQIPLKRKSVSRIQATETLVT